MDYREIKKHAARLAERELLGLGVNEVDKAAVIQMIRTHENIHSDVSDAQIYQEYILDNGMDV